MKNLFFLILCLFGNTALMAQTVNAPKNQKQDSTHLQHKIHSPRKATIRSAILPGWGQAYNKKYWKIPVVYAALGTCAGFFIYNRSEYIAARDAYRYKMDADPSNDGLIDKKFIPVDPEAIRQYRIAVRQNVDYSVLAFLICWGLNVVDATVDGHLKTFEINEKLSLQINPGYIPQTKQTQIGLVLQFHSSRKNQSR